MVARLLRLSMVVGLSGLWLVPGPCALAAGLSATLSAGSPAAPSLDAATGQAEIEETQRRISELADGSKYPEAIDLAARLTDKIKARADVERGQYGQVLYNLADLLRLARRPEAVERFRDAAAEFETLSAAEPENPEWQRRLIRTYEQLVSAGDQPVRHVEQALAALQRLRSQRRLEPWEKNWPGEFEVRLRRTAAERLVRSGKFVEAVSMAERRADVELRRESASEAQRGAAGALGNAVWAALFARQPAKAAVLSERAMALAPDQLWLKVNYAHALLLLGRHDAAKAIYLQHKGEIIPDQGRWEGVVAADFIELRQHVIADPAMDDIEHALGVVDSPVVLERRVEVLRAESRNAEALALIEQHTQAVKTRRGEDSLAYGRALDALARYAYFWAPASRHAEWEAAERRAVEIFERLLSPDDPRTREARQSLARFYLGQRARDAESEKLLTDNLSACERMPAADRTTFACLYDTTMQLAGLYDKMGRDADVERLWRRDVATAEAKWGLEHLNVVPFLDRIRAGFEERLKIKDRINTILAAAVIADDYDCECKAHKSLFVPVFAVPIDRYEKAGQTFEAEQALKFLAHRFADRRSSLRLVDLYIEAQRIEEAKAASKVLVSEMEAELPTTTWIAGDLVALDMKLAKFHHELGEEAEAALYRQRALSIYEHLVTEAEPDQWQVAKNLGLLADLYAQQQRFDDATAALKRAIMLREATWSTYRPRATDLRDSLALVYKQQRKDVIAAAAAADGPALDPDAARTCGAGEVDILSVLDDWPARKGEMLGRCPVREWTALNSAVDPVLVAMSGDADRAERLSTIAAFYYERGDWANALALYARADELLRRLARRNQAVSAPLPGTWRRTDGPALFYVRAAYELARSEPARWRELVEASFAMAQQTQRSSAASALAQMAFREAKGGSRLAALLRERQSLADESQILDKDLRDSVVSPAGRRDVTAEQRQRARAGAIDARIADIDTRLAHEFPDYAALAQASPLGLTRTQELLRPGEALVLFLEAPDYHRFTFNETFVFAVTRTDVRWERIEHRATLGRLSLESKVAFMRCGLDRSNWASDSETFQYCRQLWKEGFGGKTNGDLAGRSAAEWFDTAFAYDLYRTLFGQVEDLVKDKHLLIVPSESLTQLPFHVLVTEKPGAARWGEGGYGDARWLVRRQPMAVLPSVGSLEVLRRMKGAQARRPFIGFGDPLLDGRPGNPIHAGRARLARARQTCTAVSASGARDRIQAALPALSLIGSLFRGGLADVAVLRQQLPLPETTDELCAVARDLGAADSDVWLGRRMTETAVKDLSREGRLRDYRVLHFATHGLVAGDLDNPEPALMFSPPETATERDDGLLTASEVAQLQLDADWVVLSACNTAAGASGNQQALSGLARAFFYAGARALLVSHWSVESDAAVAITAGAFKALNADPSIGRAEALRRSITALIATGGRNAHPSVWAPFVLVGDGR